MGVIRFLGQHKGAVALVMLLLLLKAGCELAIPVLTSQIVDVGIAQSGVEDLDVLAGYKAAGVDLFPIQMAYLLRIGGLMLLAAAGSMVLDVAAGHTPASNMPGFRRSLATSAANAAGGMKPRAWARRGGSSRPFSRNSGMTRQAHMASTHPMRTNQNCSQLIGAHRPHQARSPRLWRGDQGRPLRGWLRPAPRLP